MSDLGEGGPEPFRTLPLDMGLMLREIKSRYSTSYFLFWNLTIGSIITIVDTLRFNLITSVFEFDIQIFYNI